MTHEEIAAYVDATCAALGIALRVDERERVIAHFARTVTLAAPLLAVDLPSDVDPAPIFRP